MRWLDKIESTVSRHHRHDIRIIGVLSVVAILIGGLMWNVGEFWKLPGHFVLTVGTVSLGLCLNSFLIRRKEEHRSEQRATELFEHRKQVLDMVRDGIHPPIAADTEMLRCLRAPVYIYHQTTWYDGKTIWRQCKYEFDRVERPGFLFATFEAKDRSGRLVNYIVRGYRIGVRLILVQQQEDPGLLELPSIHVFGHAGEGFDQEAGLAWVHTWSKSQICAPVLLMDQAVDGTPKGQEPTATQTTVEDPNLCETLQRTWAEAMERQDLIHPSVGDAMGVRKVEKTILQRLRSDPSKSSAAL